MELAIGVEIDIRQIQRIEAGEIATSILSAYMIARKLGVTIDSLFD